MGKWTQNGYCHPCRRPEFRQAWRKWRKARLLQFPLCAKCHRPGSHLDHIKPLHKIASWDRITLRQLLDGRNVQTLCRKCHDLKSADENATRSPPPFCDCGLPWKDGAPICGKAECQVMPV